MSAKLCEDCYRVEKLENDLQEFKEDMKTQMEKMSGEDEKLEKKIDRLSWLIVSTALVSVLFQAIVKFIK